MNLIEILTADSELSAIAIMILAGIIIIIPILCIIAFFNISSNTTTLTKQIDFLNKQVSYLIQLEERKQGMRPNPLHIQQNYDNSGFDNRQ